MPQPRRAFVFQKVLASLINTSVVVMAGTALLPLVSSVLAWKIVVVGIFFLYNLVFLASPRKRCLGMMIAGTEWERAYPLKQHLLLNVFYTASFAALFWWLWFPFDLFLYNMLIVQLPSVMITGSTFHGFISGRMRTRPTAWLKSGISSATA